MPLPIAERDLLKQIAGYLALRSTRTGIFWWRANAGAAVAIGNGKRRFVRFGLAGQPDILAVEAGLAIAIEVKREGAAQSPAQREFQTRFEAAGGRYLLVHDACEVEDGLGWIPSPLKSRLSYLERV